MPTPEVATRAYITSPVAVGVLGGMGPGRRSSARGTFVALGVLLAGFALRMWASVGPSFWFDEAYSAVVARGSVADILATIAADDFHPPLHYLLFHYWRMLAGESELSLRLTS